jgi:hypothetical protein
MFHSKDIFDKIKLLKKITINNYTIYRPITKEIKDILSDSKL